MKILHIDLEAGWRGGERQVLLLMEGLRKLDISSSAVCRPGRPLGTKLAAADFNVYEPALPWRGWTEALRAARDADILHSHTGRAHTLGAFLKAAAGRPLVVTRRVIFRPGGGPLTRWKYRQADRVVCVCRAVQSLLEAWGMPPAKLNTIYSAAPPPPVISDASKTDLRAQLGIPAGRPVVGTVGALSAEKDQATFLRAAALLREQGSDAFFLIVGDGPLRSELGRLARRLDLDDSLSMPGFREDAAAVTGLLDVFALSSLEEGIGGAILDAFHQRVPVIASSVGGLPELVQNEQSGLLFQPRDADSLAAGIARLLKEDELRSRVTEAAARLAAERHSVAVMVAAYRKIYLELC